MGIPQLTTYLFEHPEVKGAWEWYALQNTRLVIDGLSLMVLLLRSSGVGGQPCDVRCGGQYSEFYARTRDFFRRLTEKCVCPIIILDGVDERDAKRYTMKKRVLQRIQNQQTLCSVEDQRQASYAVDSSLPAWCTLVMRAAVIDSGVPCITADGEADAVTAALGRLWDCPVLSSDSDFFLFDLPAGLIHLRDVNMTKPCGRVRRFLRSRLLQQPVMSTLSHSIDGRLLGLAAGLAGNDYVTGDDLPIVRRLYSCYTGHHNVVKALYWLVSVGHCRTAQEGLRMVEDSLARSVKDRVMTALVYCVAFYDIASAPRQFEAARLVQSLDVTALRPHRSCGLSDFPWWLVIAFRLSGFPSLALNAVQEQQLCSTGTYLEDIREDPISKADSGLRSVMYGIMLAAGRRPSAAKPLRVLELSRASGSTHVQESYVVAKHSLPPLFPSLPSFADVEAMDGRLRRRLLLLALDSDGCVEHLPLGWQLPIAAVRHWICVSRQIAHTPTIYKRHVLTLVAVMVNSCPLPDGPLCSQLPHVRNFNNLQAFLAGKDCPLVVNTEVQPASLQCGKLNVAVVHVFNQWQRIVHSAMNLNCVLNYPLPWPQLQMMFDGVKAYRIFIDTSLDEDGIKRLADGPLFENLYSAVVKSLQIESQPTCVRDRRSAASSRASASAASAKSARVRREKRSLPNMFAVLSLDNSGGEIEEEEDVKEEERERHTSGRDVCSAPQVRAHSGARVVAGRRISHRRGQVRKS